MTPLKVEARRVRAARALGAVTRGARIATGATMAAMVACVGVIDERQSRSRLVFWFGAIFWRDNLETAEVACHGGLIGRPDLVFEVMRKCSFLGVVFKPRILESRNPMTGPQPTRQTFSSAYVLRVVSSSSLFVSASACVRLPDASAGASPPRWACSRSGTRRRGRSSATARPPARWPPRRRAEPRGSGTGSSPNLAKPMARTGRVEPA